MFHLNKGLLWPVQACSAVTVVAEGSGRRIRRVVGVASRGFRRQSDSRFHFAFFSSPYPSGFEASTCVRSGREFPLFPQPIRAPLSSSHSETPPRR